MDSRSDGAPGPKSKSSPAATGPADQRLIRGKHATDRWADVSTDDSDVGWGDEAGRDAGPRSARWDSVASGGRGDDWYLDERPPHHG